ncbi:Glyoxylase, beta-lactamase superfamily II [Actinacidiphila yanglinensis]|uniref:Glyoxylase, beta-lactamase superfamily II n=1 Tax=Actinacidiphila yanglinensis TaxID=310779 RepID=A0A1H5YU52_9ACTN|nr:MBL fold metallo-hydrolase [Actinacidiphila yanglinensis]SEG27498.1 Glyoxylase, beta-lactamase superfamily II [Actinacidiphila yanglinensis]
MTIEPPRRLHALTPAVHAWLPDGHGTWGLANCVLVAGEGTALLVDTPYTADLTRHLMRLSARVLRPGTEITTVVNTHGNGDHSYGNGLFTATGAEVISTDANTEHLCKEPSPAQLAALVAGSDPGTPLGAYVTRHFGRYGDFGVSEAVPPTRTFGGRLDLDVSGVAVELIEVGPAHTVGDLIVHLPTEGVVCAGDVIFCDDHPVHWAGPLDEVHRAVQRVLACDPQVVVPGHGPLMTPADVGVYADYLLQTRDRIHTAHAAGHPLAQAAAEVIAGDTHPHWKLAERLAILTAVEYRALDGDTAPVDLISLVDLAARHTDPVAL